MRGYLGAWGRRRGLEAREWCGTRCPEQNTLKIMSLDLVEWLAGSLLTMNRGVRTKMARKEEMGQSQRN